MFIKKMPFTESIESHLNSSSDSIGEDDSFDDFNSEKKDFPSIEDIKFKHKRYENFRRKIIIKKKELEDDKTGTMWKSLYYTFFNNQVKNSITINELELRCKFLFNMDKINNLNDEIKKKNIETLTNLEPFIQYYKKKKDDNFLINIFSKEKNEEEEEENKNEKLNKTLFKIKYSRNNIKKENSKIEKRFLSMDKIYYKKRKRIYNSLFEIYGFKENEELIEAITRVNEKYKNEKNKIYLDNLNKINEGKFAFSREVQLIEDTFHSNEAIKNDIQGIINVNHNSKFFEENMDKDLIKEYSNKLEPQNRMSRQINTLNNKILSKIDPSFKIII